MDKQRNEEHSDEHFLELIGRSVRKSRTCDCIIWMDRIGVGDLPLMRSKSDSSMSVRRWLAEWRFNWNLGPGEQVKTTCGTRLCVKPSHLYIRGRIRGELANYIIENGKRKIIEIED